MANEDPVPKEAAGESRIARSIKVKPHKGRRKDLKRIDAFIGELQDIVDQW